MMPDTGDDQTLDTDILGLLTESDGELTPDEVEEQLEQRRGNREDTFAVRRAIWRLVLQGRAVLTPRRGVKAR